ncbi:hypothetical protein JOF42_000364 [Microbacterium phyllosphaerae]|uniref:SIR2-like domain-containing protein n=1 Tax=Microbacterium phyllosphaerae TaxID=124798 RepID=A0ABS4WMW5_9MICO|nr:SIR2 family protein [Microbacterium phyllosphaerae]MBP2376869.1 hypothetical protein [Microbacterium phyllosphaerae]
MMQVTRTAGSRTAYVLGAGFSYAVSELMPMTDRLGAAVAEELGLRGSVQVPDFAQSGITFETWMSWLAEQQPYQSEAEHHEDLALYSLFTHALATVLDGFEQGVLADGLPSWLHTFVDLVHWQRDDILTFNYDTLLETALEAQLRVDTKGRVHAGSVVAGFPSSKALMFNDGRGHIEERDTFALYKLHGSVDWFAVSGDRSAATLDRFATSDFANLGVREMAIEGRDVFLVPPTSTKSGYFDNPKTRYIWRKARAALQDADRVVLMGYSLPLTDAAMARMLWSVLPMGSQEIVIVNPFPEDVRSHLKALGVREDRIRHVAGVAEFVAAELEARSADVARALSSALPERPVIVAWSEHEAGAITSATFDTVSGTLYLAVDALDQSRRGILHPAAVSLDANTRRTKSVGELLEMGRPSRIVAQYGDQSWVVGGRFEDPTADDEEWVVLAPSGRTERQR